MGNIEEKLCSDEAATLSQLLALANNVLGVSDLPEAAPILASLHTRFISLLLRSLVSAMWVEELEKGLSELEKYKDGALELDRVMLTVCDNLLGCLNAALPAPEVTPSSSAAATATSVTSISKDVSPSSSSSSYKPPSQLPTADYMFIEPPPLINHRLPVISSSQYLALRSLCQVDGGVNKSMLQHSLPSWDLYVQAMEGFKTGEKNVSLSRLLPRAETHNEENDRLRSLVQLTLMTLHAEESPSTLCRQQGPLASRATGDGSTTPSLTGTRARAAMMSTLLSVRRDVGRRLSKKLAKVTDALKKGGEKRELMDMRAAFESSILEATSLCRASMDNAIEVAPVWAKLFVARYAKTMYGVPFSQHQHSSPPPPPR